MDFKLDEDHFRLCKELKEALDNDLEAALETGKLLLVSDEGNNTELRLLSDGLTKTIANLMGVTLTSEQFLAAIGEGGKHEPITPDEINNAPVAIDDTATTNQSPNNPKIILAADLLANDSDPEDDSLTIIEVSANAVDENNHIVGVVSLDLDGNILYISTNDQFTGSATFNYLVSDGKLTDTATVAVAVGISQDFSNHNSVEGTTGDDLLNINLDSNLGTVVTGLTGDDNIHTGNGRDLIYGGLGNDLLNGSDGRDNLFGEEGNDILNGGPGIDYLWGGLGSDLFILTSGEGRDFIRDFNIAEGDRLGLSSGLTYGNNLSVIFRNNLNYIYQESSILAVVQEVTKASINDSMYFQAV
jgi:Ca2+-binding RTX toxin-like protein